MSNQKNIKSFFKKNEDTTEVERMQVDNAASSIHAAASSTVRPCNKRTCNTPEKKKRIRGESDIKLTHRAQNYRKEWKNDKLFSA